MGGSKATRIVLLGGSEVGKSTFANTLAKEHSEVREYTKAGFYVKEFMYGWRDQKQLVELYDPVSSSVINEESHYFLRTMDGVVILFDSTSQASMSCRSDWVNIMQRIKPDIPYVLCGTKADQSKITCVVAGPKPDYLMDTHQFWIVDRALTKLLSKMPGQKKKHKVILVGDSESGKTTWLKRLRTGEFEKKYLATIGVETHTCCGFDFWDTAGQKKFAGLADGYYVGADAAVIFFDTTSKTSYDNVVHWYDAVRRVCPNIPVVLCGNKIDLRDQQIDFSWSRYALPLLVMSAKTNYNQGTLIETLEKLLQPKPKPEPGPMKRVSEYLYVDMEKLIRESDRVVEQVEESMERAALILKDLKALQQFQ